MTQFGWGLQMENRSAISQLLGADEKDIPILWLAAPLTGLILWPIIGYTSDQCSVLRGLIRANESTRRFWKR